MRRPWRRFLAVAILVMLALLRVEALHDRMQGRPRGPSRIFRLERQPVGARLHLAGWGIPIHPTVTTAVAQTPSRVREGVEELWRQVEEQVRAWRSSPSR